MKIYRIFSEEGNCCYIGKTRAKLLCKRLAQHRYNFRNNIGSCTSFNVLKFNDCKIELVETLGENDCSKEREKYYINNFKNTVNKYLNKDFSRKQNIKII